MRWITEAEQAKELLLQAGTCQLIDNRRVSTSLVCSSFDDVALCTKGFHAFIQALMQLSSDENLSYIVLDPDPVQYFHRHFNKYPILEVCADDPLYQYLSLLSQDPGSSPADAVGTNCYEWVMLPHSHKWFIHSIRMSDDCGGHLWLPQSWLPNVLDGHKWLTYPGSLAPNTDPTWA